MISAEGGTAGPPTSHMVITARSKSLAGPWENSPHNPLVHTWSADERWWSKGHGTLVDDGHGHWWIVYHAYENGAYPLGRQTLIEPVQWTADGWIDAAPNAPRLPEGVQDMPLSDDFAGPALGLQWTTWRDYDPADFTLKNGGLHCAPKAPRPPTPACCSPPPRTPPTRSKPKSPSRPEAPADSFSSTTKKPSSASPPMATASPSTRTPSAPPAMTTSRATTGF